MSLYLNDLCRFCGRCMGVYAAYTARFVESSEAPDPPQVLRAAQKAQIAANCSRRDGFAVA